MRSIGEAAFVQEVSPVLQSPRWRHSITAACSICWQDGSPWRRRTVLVNRERTPQRHSALYRRHTADPRVTALARKETKDVDNSEREAEKRRRRGTDTTEEGKGGDDGNTRSFRRRKVMVDLCLRVCVWLSLGKREMERQMVISRNWESLMRRFQRSICVSCHQLPWRLIGTA